MNTPPAPYTTADAPPYIMALAECLLLTVPQVQALPPELLAACAAATTANEFLNALITHGPIHIFPGGAHAAIDTTRLYRIAKSWLGGEAPVVVPATDAPDIYICPVCGARMSAIHVAGQTRYSCWDSGTHETSVVVSHASPMARAALRRCNLPLGDE